MLAFLTASCGSNKTENDAMGDTALADTLADAPMPMPNDTLRVTDGKPKEVPPINDTLQPPH